jgi:hypothetical protein
LTCTKPTTTIGGEDEEADEAGASVPHTDGRAIHPSDVAWPRRFECDVVTVAGDLAQGYDASPTAGNEAARSIGADNVVPVRPN